MADLERQLRRDVEGLCDLGPRCLGLGTLNAARDWLRGRIGARCYVNVHSFSTPDGDASNLELRHHDAAADPEGAVLLVGAHYDTFAATPGTDDNASAVACLLHMLDALADLAREDLVRFVLYANEEPPYFRGPHMGSLHHATRCRDRRWDVEMLCLESLGYFSKEAGSQQDPSARIDPAMLRAAGAVLGIDLPEPVASGGLLGDVGDFLALEADAASSRLLARLVAGYAAPPGPRVRTVAAALPRELCTGLSDHWSYWQRGFPAVMATDTALYRNPNYHEPGDTPDTLDYARLAAVTRRLTAAVRHAVG